MYKRPKESNLMYNYFSPDSAVYTIIGSIREGILRGEKRGFDPGVIKRAKAEFEVKMAALDASTYPFAQDLSKHLYKDGKTRVIMLVEGTFHGKGDIKSIIPVDLGNNPYLLFQDGQPTIDHYVTMEKTREFIDTNRKYLKQNGCKYFDIEKSRFFSFKESDLRKFMIGDRKYDMKRIVPLLSPTDFVVLDKVEPLSIESYLGSAPPLFHSYRLKKSTVRKLLGHLFSKEGEIHIEYNNDKHIEDQKKVISDIAANRIVGEKEEISKLERLLLGKDKIEKHEIKIGNSTIVNAFKKRDYGEETDSGFRATLIIASIITPGYELTTRELQLVPRAQYYINEILDGRIIGSDKGTKASDAVRRINSLTGYYGEIFLDGRTTHSEHDKRRSHVARRIKSLKEHYKKILLEIFDRHEDVIEI